MTGSNRSLESVRTPEAAELNLHPPRGVMLVGVQGCGKSLAAKVIARRCAFELSRNDEQHWYQHVTELVIGVTAQIGVRPAICDSLA